MTAAEKLRKIIKEEVRKAVREEVSKIITESTVKRNYANSLEDEVKTKVPKNINVNKTINKAMPKFDNTNPFASMLNETALSFSSDDVHSFGHKSQAGFFQQEETRAGTVDGMLATARPSSNLDMVQINEVPDFSALMKKMNL